ncbi:MAG: putative metallopeptidase, partial [Acidithiobacillus sp.]|uniref:putative metallopeptidase n=1 Tax=Acidithiobacillus sp. TaxID=1872118 RepID=UPI00355F903C
KKVAEVAVISRRLDHFVDSDYILSVHEESWDEISEAEKYLVILHELMHIPEEGFDIEDKHYKKLIDHNIKDFRYILKEFGVDWEDSKKILDDIKQTADVKKKIEPEKQEETNTGKNLNDSKINFTEDSEKKPKKESKMDLDDDFENDDDLEDENNDLEEDLEDEDFDDEDED